MRALVAAVAMLLAGTVCEAAPRQRMATVNHKPTCDPNPADTVADFSMHVTDLRLNGKPIWNRLHELGIKTIVRYYDWDPESLACKTLFRDETNAILANAFNLAVVFQHFNGDPETFIDPTRGKTDAERSLELAEHNGQPAGSTIYFGVDGADQVIKDAAWEYTLSKGPMSPARRALLLRQPTKDSPNKAYDPAHVHYYDRFLQYRISVFGPSMKGVGEDSLLPFVETYFKAVDEVFRARFGGTPRYEIGAYGSGSVCRYLLSRPVPVVKRCWLAQSTGWPKYDPFADEKPPRWSMLQKNPTYCLTWRNVRPVSETPGFDFNFINPGEPKIGQWSQAVASTRELPRPHMCQPLPN